MEREHLWLQIVGASVDRPDRTASVKNQRFLPPSPLGKVFCGRSMIAPTSHIWGRAQRKKTPGLLAKPGEGDFDEFT